MPGSKFLVSFNYQVIKQDKSLKKEPVTPGFNVILWQYLQ